MNTFNSFQSSSVQPLQQVVNLYVKLADSPFTDPYYVFYSDESLTIEYGYTLNLKHKYIINSANNGHPFFISDNGYGNTSTNKVIIESTASATSGISGTGSTITLTFSGLATTDTLTYYCTSHSSMQKAFTLSYGA